MTLLLKGLPLFLCSFSGHLELVQKIFEKSSLVAGFLSNFCTEQKIKSLNHHQHLYKGSLYTSSLLFSLLIATLVFHGDN